MLSPKGRFRLFKTMLAGIALLLLGMWLDPNNLIGWISTSSVKVGTALLATSAWYYVGRELLHIRTHDLPQSKQYTEAVFIQWNMALMISSALVFNGALGL